MTTDREAQLLRDAYATGITRPRELANFMAQMGHESNGLRRLDESFMYSQSAEQISGNVRSALREGRESLEAARIEALAGRPERLADLMYGGRMGNDDPGDGYRYRGRGYIQLTGKDQYAAAGEALELDLVKQPNLAAQPEHAGRIATWYWRQNVPADVRDDPRAAGAAINGRDPPNGLADRVHHFERWERELTAERVQGLATEEPMAETRDAAKRPSFEDAMRIMLPPQAGVAPHVTGHFGEHRGERTHGGTDFNYVGGQTGINREHPVVHSPVAGVVTFSGGDFGTVKIRDAQGHSHEILHLQGRVVESGQTVAAGEVIGTMGGRGPRGADQYAQHVHYQLRNPQGEVVSPEDFWNQSRTPVYEEAEATRSNGLLRSGDRGADVRALQDTLSTLGFADADNASLRVDGVFGARTAEALRAFQQAHGLQVDGIVGPDTRDALANASRTEALRQPDIPTAAARATPLDALLAAARDGDPATLKAALADFSETAIGRSFQAAHAGQTTEVTRNAEALAPQQGECAAR